MEFKQLFASMVVVVIGLFAFNGLITDFDTGFGSNISSNPDVAGMIDLQDQINSEISTISGTAQSNYGVEAGQNVEADPEQGAFRRGLNVVLSVGSLVNMPGKLIAEFASALGAPTALSEPASWLFNFVFYITLGYALVFGARRLLGQ